MSRPSPHIEDMPAAYYATRKTPDGWRERLRIKAQKITGQTSGAVFDAKYAMLLVGYGAFLTLDEEVESPDFSDLSGFSLGFSIGFRA